MTKFLLRPFCVGVEKTILFPPWFGLMRQIIDGRRLAERERDEDLDAFVSGYLALRGDGDE